MSRFAQILIERLQWTRLRLLDVYGNAPRLTSDAAPAGPVPFPRRSGGRRLADTWTLDLEPSAPSSGPGRGSSRCSTPSDRRVPISVLGDVEGPARPHGARGRSRHAGDLRVGGRSARRPGPFGNPWPIEAAAGATSSWSRAGSAWRRCGPCCTTSRPRGLRRGRLLYGSRTPADLLYPDELSAWSAVASRSTSRWTPPRAAGRQGRRRPEADRRAPSSTPTRPSHSSCGPGDHDALHGPACSSAASPRTGSTSRWSGHAVRRSAIAATASSARRYLPRRPRLPIGRARAADGGAGALSDAAKPKLAVWKFASCDGCQLSLLDCEDELLALAGEVEIAHFLEATRAVVEGPYDLSLVEGSSPPPTTWSGSARSGASRTGSSRSARARRRAASRRCVTSPTSMGSSRPSTPPPSTSRRWLPRRRSRPTSRSTSSCTAARSTSASCWR